VKQREVLVEGEIKFQSHATSVKIVEGKRTHQFAEDGEQKAETEMELRVMAT